MKNYLALFVSVLTRATLKYRLPLVAILSVILITLSLLFAFLLRFDFELTADHRMMFYRMLVPALVIKLVCYRIVGVNRGWWRYASLADVIDIGKATLWSSISLLIFVVFVYQLQGVPRSVLILDAGITFGLLAGVRLATRMFREQFIPMLSKGNAESLNTLIIGAGESGQNIVRDIRKNDPLTRHVIGFLDDDPQKMHGRFQGIRVLGTTDSVKDVCERHEVQEIIIAIPVASATQMRRIVELAVGAGARVRTLPAVSDLIDNRVTIQQIRDVDARDLLGRRAINLDTARIEGYLRGKRILVTGAAGSIGSEIARQLTKYAPKSMTLLDHAESPLFFIEREVADLFEGELHACIADIRDLKRMADVFDSFKPQVVFHAAAYKHVPMMEHNPQEAISTNVHGTRTIADLSNSSNVESFVMISTDKAVNPTNIMGASKRCAEMYVQSLASSTSTRYTTVRFGNVLGSAGSVIPIFQKQIEMGGPVTVTHPEVTRFFMTIAEATQLVLQAGSMGKGGEIFLLDMGEPVKILNLAEELIRLSGFTPGKEMHIEFTGLRPGEKLFEELLLADEGVARTEHEAIRIAVAKRHDYDRLREKLDSLLQVSKEGNRKRMLQKLQKIVPEFKHNLNGHREKSNLASVRSLKIVD